MKFTSDYINNTFKGHDGYSLANDRYFVHNDCVGLWLNDVGDLKESRDPIYDVYTASNTYRTDPLERDEGDHEFEIRIRDLEQFIAKHAQYDFRDYGRCYYPYPIGMSCFNPIYLLDAIKYVINPDPNTDTVKVYTAKYGKLCNCWVYGNGQAGVVLPLRMPISKNGIALNVKMHY